jgi:hypothetical protein
MSAQTTGVHYAGTRASWSFHAKAWLAMAEIVTLGPPAELRTNTGGGWRRHDKWDRPDDAAKTGPDILGRFTASITWRRSSPCQ